MYNDNSPIDHIEEFNGVNVPFPKAGLVVTRPMVLRDRLTKEQTKTLVSAFPVVINSVLYTFFQNRYQKLHPRFSEADAVLHYHILAEKNVQDRRGGIHSIEDWEITLQSIAFTLYSSMIDEVDDGYSFGVKSRYYDMNYRYYYEKNIDGNWQFIKNEFLGFAPHKED